jgi:hypothetical protein
MSDPFDHVLPRRQENFKLGRGLTPIFPNLMFPPTFFQVGGPPNFFFFKFELFSSWGSVYPNFFFKFELFSSWGSTQFLFQVFFQVGGVTNMILGGWPHHFFGITTVLAVLIVLNSYDLMLT